MNRSTGLAIACIFASSHAFAQNQANDVGPAEKYWAAANYHLSMCQATFISASARAEVGKVAGTDGDYRGCIESGKKAAKGDLSVALKATKKPKAQEALKSFHVAFVAAIEGIAPGAGERKLSYEQRQQALSGKLTETWARFDVEQ